MKLRPLLAAWLLPAGVVLFATVALAGVPDPRNCVADTCLVVSPAGNFSYSVTVNDESAAPVADVQVVLDFGTATGMFLCSASDPDHDRRLVATTDAMGQVTFHVRGGGQTTGYVVVSAIGQTIVIAYPRSPDLNGDLAVTAADVSLHAALPASARAGNYDCDGDSDTVDRGILGAQVGQDCNSVPVLSFTWGAVKDIYR